MNLKYLQEEVLPIREQEIKEGKNAATRQPIYIVFDLVDIYVSGHSQFSPMLNNKNKSQVWGYLDMGVDGECREFKEDNEGMEEPEEVTQMWVDKYVALFFTREAAENYLEYQKHNLSENAYIYVEYTGYGNRQMDAIFEGK